MLFFVRHIPELFLDPEKTYGNVLGCDPDNGADLVVTEIFEPQEHYGPVEGAESADPVLEHPDLLEILCRIIKQVDVHIKGYGLAFAFLFPFRRDTGVQADAIYPGPGAALPTEFRESLP